MDKKTAIDGIIKCIKNAEKLIEDAQILFKKNHHVGTFLVTTAIEEYAKAILILGYYSGFFSKSLFKKIFRSHNLKRALANFISIIGTFVVDGNKHAINFKRLVTHLDFDLVRDGALYVDYKSGKFVRPKVNVKNFIRVLRLALRLKRLFSALKTKKACLEIISYNANLREQLTEKDRQLHNILELKIKGEK